MCKLQLQVDNKHSGIHTEVYVSTMHIDMAMV